MQAIATINDNKYIGLGGGLYVRFVRLSNGYLFRIKLQACDMYGTEVHVKIENLPDKVESYIFHDNVDDHVLTISAGVTGFFRKLEDADNWLELVLPSLLGHRYNGMIVKEII